MADDFFQCPHCHKKYAASAKAVAAAGRKIRCKSCEKPFVIKIESVEAPVAAKVEKPTPAPAEKKRQKADPSRVVSPKAKEKSSVLRWTMALLGILLVGAGALFWWLQPASSQKGVIPALPEKGAPTAAVDHGPALPDRATVAKLTREVAPIDPASRQFHAPIKCREVAAEQWLNDYTLTHSRYKQHEFVRLLDQSTALTAQMHKHCRNTLLLRSVIGSAKEGKKPTWLLSDIDALLHPEYNEDQIVGDRGL